MTDFRWVFRVKYSPDQPRVPAGSSEGGQFASSGSVRSGDGEGVGSSIPPNELFNFSTGNLKSSDELADKFGLVEKRDGKVLSWDTNKRTDFRVKGQENEWGAWLQAGRGKQHGKMYMYISKRAVPTYPWGPDAPVYGNPIVYRAEYPGDDWKEQ